MTRVCVLVPYRGDDGGARDRAWAFMSRWWASAYPRWQVVVGTGPAGPWCKAAAVQNAVDQADGDVFVIADADVLCEKIEQAVIRITAGTAAWTVPHRRVHRLSATATTRLYGGEPLPDPLTGRPRPGLRGPRRLPIDGPLTEVYAGTPGGGLVVLPRSVWQRVPMDPRFVGWGQEDTSWGRALAVLAGPPWRGHAPLWHLWHPPQDRQSRAVGSPAGYGLYQRYRRAGTPTEMGALLDEFRAVAGG